MLESSQSENMKLKVLQRLMIKFLNNAGVAQLVEQFTCNEQVAGAEPAASFKEMI